MAGREETRTVACGACRAVNHVVLAFAADGRRNVSQVLECHSCETELLTERCLSMHSAPTPEEALLGLRRMRMVA